MELRRYPVRTFMDSVFTGLQILGVIALFPLLAVMLLVGISVAGLTVLAVVIGGLVGLGVVGSKSGSAYVFDPDTGALVLERRILSHVWSVPVCVGADMVAVSLVVDTVEKRTWTYTPVLILASGDTFPIRLPVLEDREGGNLLAAATAEELGVRFVRIDKGSMLHVAFDASGKLDVQVVAATFPGLEFLTPP